MDKNALDKLFKNKLRNYEKKPRTEAWDKLELLLQDEEAKVIPLARKKRAFLWLSVAASLCILVLGWWVLYPHLSGEHEPRYARGRGVEVQPGIDSVEVLQKPHKELSKSNRKKLAPQTPEKSQELDIEIEITSSEQQTTERLVKNKDPKNVKNNSKENNTNPKDNFKIPEEDLLQNPTQIAKNEESEYKGFKIVVKVKISESTKQTLQAEKSEETLAQHEPQEKKGKKFLTKIKKSEQDKEFKILGIDPEKILASIGK